MCRADVQIAVTSWRYLDKKTCTIFLLFQNVTSLPADILLFYKLPNFLLLFMHSQRICCNGTFSWKLTINGRTDIAENALWPTVAILIGLHMQLTVISNIRKLKSPTYGSTYLHTILKLVLFLFSLTVCVIVILSGSKIVLILNNADTCVIWRTDTWAHNIVSSKWPLCLFLQIQNGKVNTVYSSPIFPWKETSAKSVHAHYNNNNNNNNDDNDQ